MWRSAGYPPLITLSIRHPFCRRWIHAAGTLPRRSSDIQPILTKSELVDRICRILTLERFEAIPKLPFDFYDDILDAVMGRLQLNPTACLGFFNIAMKQANFTPNTKSYCKIIHILNNGRMFDDARALTKDLIQSRSTVSFVFNEMLQVYKDFSFSLKTFDIFFKAYADGGLVKEALFMFDSMGSHGWKPSVRSCNSMLNCLVKAGEHQTAALTYEQMLQVGILPDVYTVSAMINAYCKGGRVQKAAEFMASMKNKGFEVNLVAHHSLMDGFCSIGQTDHAIEVLSQ
ncbi:putative pentatricopeptide repeat-containing protein [Platanthera guangdongensis]|uniref:Pentatricopeptide repeat-containing protein n=1 Tax=Platanthera guangdongensis TaxID=2320717 RepID=A0ABR2LDS5_9ASPA